MSGVLIVYHSHTGNTEAMAKAIYDGAVSAGAKVTLRKAADATAEDILDCDVIAFGTPNNFRYMAGKMKDFFDRVWVTIGDRTGSKVYATFSSSGGGGRQAIQAIESIEQICDVFSQWKQVSFKKTLQGIVATGKPSAQILQECKEMGAKLARL
jgi:multimeric flavodoxin WrbA